MTTRSNAGFASAGFNKRASLIVTRQYRAHQVVFAQGDGADAMFRIQRGNVKLTTAASGNKKASIAILGSGDCFGEGCLARNTRRTCTAISIHRSTIDRVSRRVMIRRLRQEPLLAARFISYLLFRIGRVEEDLVDQLVNSSERRLARLLLQLSDFSKLAGRRSAVVSVDQGTLAQVVGTTRSRVSHFMNQFRKKGFIEYNGSLRVRKGLLTFLLRAQ